MILRSDYRASDFLLDRIELHVSVEALTTVEAWLHLRRRPGADPAASLVLDGRGIELLSIELDGTPIAPSGYRIEPEQLVVPAVPDAFVLRTLTRNDPEKNTVLEGWYRSGPMLCTQCEAQGFSRITYALDRPDVLSRFRVRLEAETARYPVLLANGNCVESGDAGPGRHYAVWEDPHPKPCYLFAMVAGDLACVEGRHRTPSGRDVALRFYVDRGNENRVAHAMESLRKAMQWDESVYGLEYDLDIYMVVAARDFNMGAMENKGLNLFNARFVLASPQTATDVDYDGVESVIAHEYFHNWTGNRVTCRDWFQLSLKEGLTVYRDQCFSADLGSRDVTRIEHVRTLRALQFPEDAGPTAHPVRPDAYAEVNNLYTATVYEKGAEILRMLASVIGEETFVAGIGHYLKQHDGTAATVEDLLASLEAVSGQKLDGFRRWYSQSGTPSVEITDEYDAAEGRYTLRLRQHTAPTHDQAQKTVLPIPLRFSLRDDDGQLLQLSPQPPLMPRADLILLEAAEAELRFDNIESRPTPAFLHGFSAPVKLQYAYTPDALSALVLNEEDGFLRWEASQRLMFDALFETMNGEPGEHSRMLLHTLQVLAANPPADKALLAELLRLPAESELAAQIEPLDPHAVTRARDGLRHAIAQALTGPLSVWAAWMPTDLSPENRARRSLSNLALWYLGHLNSARIRKLALERAHSPNMSLAIGGLAALRDSDSAEREEAMDAFHLRFRDEPLVLDKWFAMEAASARPAGLERVTALLTHPDFKPNPNRTRAVLGTFMRENLRSFHAPDGGGYRLLATELAKIDAGNPQLAARLVEGLLGWRRLVPALGEHMRAALEQLAQAGPSRDVAEKIGKALESRPTA
ncbi:alanyl aminopeptidase [Panacagrimonas perspica]|uniref:Aminopeptidase N n=1 Tax=Panacagrimonas perspica TaxID=381431 RepID=A0A4R7PFH4_9GAMM|nr:aminopeptidase N [Panacagrimonas perspica]TDU32532.1 alanyl aminopeptidase [Panacagrimonas perspica]THD05436.1 aminopeptidase N [Panacagrimonas perspica]